MSVWYAIPTARPDGGTIPKWQEAGYKVAACVDEGNPGNCKPDLFESILTYPGYAASVNWLIAAVLKLDPECSWVVTGGDDILPDPNHTPDEIAAQCAEHFGEYLGGYTQPFGHLHTFGVMQPTGDRWAGGSIDRICGSPWMGREFCEQMYGGDGPLWSGWFHMFPDEELQEVAKKLGVLWQRRDLIHKHNHWARRDGPQDVDFDPRFEPEHLKDKNPTLQRDRPLFNQRKARGFPGHEPLNYIGQSRHHDPLQPALR